MRKVFAIAVLGLVALTVPALAVDVVDDTDFGPGGGVGERSQTCPGTVVWDTGMYDEFTPPASCASAFSVGCFINAIDDGGFGADWRQGAAQFIGTGGDPVTQVKVWARYNQQGYDYHLLTPGSLHGFCVRFYDDPAQGSLCPDGTIPDALGAPVYEVYTQTFVEEEIFTGVVRNFCYCIELPCPGFSLVQDHFYWASVSADFDFTSYGGGVTQYFWRMAGPGTAILCEPVANYNSTVGDHQPWDVIWRAIAQTCWQGWDTSLILYTNFCQQQTGACCVGGACTVTTEAECMAAGGTYQGDGVPCVPDPCIPDATQPSTWGQIKNSYK